MYSDSTKNTRTTAINVSNVKTSDNSIFEPTIFIKAFVASALITNGNVNAEKLG